MGIKKHEHFDSRIEVSSCETRGESKKLEAFSEDAYDDLFDKKLAYLDMAESLPVNKTNSLDNMKLNDFNNLNKEKDTKYRQKKNISNNASTCKGNFTMNSRATLDYRIEHTDESKREDFIKEIETSAVGGKDGHHAHLIGSGKELYVMHSKDKLASGRFSVKDYPGNDVEKRREDVQAYFENDCSVVDKVRTTRGVVAFESKVAPQPEWAEKAGYKAREGVTQTYIPLVNGRRPLEEGILKIDKDNKE